MWELTQKVSLMDSESTHGLMEATTKVNF